MTSITSITSKNKKKVLSESNVDVNTNVKLHVIIRPKSTTLEQSNLPIKIASEPTLTHKETIQTILSDNFTEPTKDICIYDFDAENTQEDPQKIEISMWSDSEIKILLEFWKENLEEWKRGKVKVYQKIISENVLPGRTLDQFRNKSKAINPDYVTDSTSDSPPISDGENSDNKENYKADETRKKKRKSTGIEGMDEKGGENEREREREQKI
ncbi:hypothetical protein RhiirA5_410478 [Rhizophagus irregularis]|uniref:Uncharacterized protein n=1 Tax=Rhizophagus irregularis TaxID=588596 RepID=A0A2N0Q3D2_9GLOM|nr:hypothetical protein RhiirA5_410478 [Rhizophagus irregularis]